jgi:hypothetical protein
LLIKSPQSLKKAIIVAVDKDPKKPLSRIYNFRENWDFLRFVCLVEALEVKEEPWKRFQSIKPLLVQCRGERNVNAHDDFVRDKAVLDDDDLMKIVCSTSKYILTVNDLDKKSERAIKIGEKLKRLRECLYRKNRKPEDELEVFAVEEEGFDW